MKQSKWITCSLLGIAIFSTEASTAIADSIADSKATVDFGVDTTPVDPTNPEVVDPTNPDQPAVPVNPGTNPKEGTGGSGTKSFHINWISNFKFGTIDIASSGMQAWAQPTTLTWKSEAEGGNGAIPTTNLAPFLQITDNRGTGAGWNISVSGTEFYELTSEGVPTANTLKGASIYLDKPQIVGVDSVSNSIRPVALNASGTTDILATGAQGVPIFSAEANKGQGTWSVTWGAAADKTTYQADKGVRLSVPSTSTPKVNTKYVSDLTWTLVDVPVE